jgi:hypothetical protein
MKVTIINNTRSLNDETVKELYTGASRTSCPIGMVYYEHKEDGSIIATFQYRNYGRLD